MESMKLTYENQDSLALYEKTLLDTWKAKIFHQVDESTDYICNPGTGCPYLFNFIWQM